MKITRKQLKRIIKEELSRTLTVEGASRPPPNWDDDRSSEEIAWYNKEKAKLEADGEFSDEDEETLRSRRNQFIAKHEEALQAYIKSAMAGSADVVAALKESFSNALNMSVSDGQMYQLLTTMLYQEVGDPKGNPSWGIKLVLSDGEKGPLQGGSNTQIALGDGANVIWQAADRWESGKGAFPNLSQEDALKVAEDMGRKGWSSTIVKYDFANPLADRRKDAAIIKVIQKEQILNTWAKIIT